MIVVILLTYQEPEYCLSYLNFDYFHVLTHKYAKTFPMNFFEFTISF